MEQLFLSMAFHDYRDYQSKRDEEQEETIIESGGSRVLRDEEAKKIADTPILTGDPWFDKMERAETDASKPLLET